MKNTLKKIGAMIVAGAVGAALTIGAYSILSHNSNGSFVPPGLVKATGTQTTALYSPVTAANPDFTTAAELAMPVVVQIRARESDALAQQRREEQQRNDPWSRFFDFGFGNNDFFQLPFYQYRQKQGAGSGVIISDDGYIVTNNHVIDFADQVKVRLSDGREFEAEIIGRDPSTDLAVIRIDAKGLPTLPYGDSDKVRVGEWVLAVGNPFEYLTSTVTAGIVSAKGRDIDLIQGEKAIEEFIQTDAAINPGNSGGALVDAQGRLIGINTAIASFTGNYAGYSFAIPVNLMNEIVNDIIENGGGVIERTSLGVYVDELDETLAEELGTDIDEGLVVLSLVPGSSAEYAGLLPNDIILSVDGEKVTEFDQLKRLIDFSKVGDTIAIKVSRNGEVKEIPVRLRRKL